MSERGQPRPSIYIRLMPLMYGLIGASAAMFLNALFCGRPVASRATTKCKPPATTRAGAGAVQGRAAAEVSPAAADGGRKARAKDLASAGGRKEKAKDLALAGGRKAKAKDLAPAARKAKAKDLALAARAKAAKPVEKKVPSARPPAPTAEERLLKAIRPCARSRARSFRLAVRLYPDGKVRRAFVARDLGVNAAMSACIRRRVAELSLPLKLHKGYAEWRVRRTDKGLSLELIRPHWLRRR